MTTISFYFDPISPYAYLAASQLDAIATETSCSIEPIPILLAAVLNQLGQKGPAEIEIKRRYTMLDVLRWADTYQLPLVGPPTHPFNPLLPLRVLTAIGDPRARWSATKRLLEAAWGEGRDLTVAAVLVGALHERGLDGEAYLQQAQDPVIKSELRQNTETAMGCGVFGVPTCRVGEVIFWGNDRLSFLNAHLLGTLPAVDEGRLQSLISRPASAMR